MTPEWSLSLPTAPVPGQSLVDWQTRSSLEAMWSICGPFQIARCVDRPARERPG